MFTIPLIGFLVVCGIGETILTFSWQAVFKKVDFPALGRPMIATTAVFNGSFVFDSISFIVTIIHLL